MRAKNNRRRAFFSRVMLKSAIGANKSGDILLVGALSSIIVRHCDRRYNSKPPHKSRLGDRGRAITFFQRGKNDESPKRQRWERAESGHNDTHETVMRPHAKNGGIAANKSHDKAVILFTFPLTGAAKVPLPSPSPIMLISFRRPHVHNGEEAECGRRERVRHATRRRIAQSQSHTPRRGHAPPLSPPRRRTRASGPGSRRPDLALIRASASVILSFSIRGQSLTFEVFELNSRNGMRF